MPGLIAAVAKIPVEADLRLLEPGPVPVAIYGGEAHVFPGSGADITIPLGDVRDLQKIDRVEFFARLMLHETTKFLIAGVPVAFGGYAGDRGTAFDEHGPRALSPAERAAIESRHVPQVGAFEFIEQLLRGAAGRPAR
jgi:hypothetical protein